TRAYLRHLFHAQETLGPRLASIHNLRFLIRLMEQSRAAILAGHWTSFRDAWLARYRPVPDMLRAEQRLAFQRARERDHA
ncbi:MAG: tRNA guanosine(34) transglycosylase Tgt, partial [Herpetosiphonaceae bacterium]|nr:tRNA guanosine(34) transglycosylase Tgt [Herpetosiphonaceae bacterium]